MDFTKHPYALAATMFVKTLLQAEPEIPSEITINDSSAIQYLISEGFEKIMAMTHEEQDFYKISNFFLAKKQFDIYQVLFFILVRCVKTRLMTEQPETYRRTLKIGFSSTHVYATLTELTNVDDNNNEFDSQNPFKFSIKK